ncbi:hypothetical protein [Thiohalophilus sp.]|uniref:hypothetical protein n=1 Tax=Thiohalophilus sp. TaxID=3028392 RepID=UPI002ACE2CC3|nr:hypothetical protein [Thiohalophilus sp.]MDZ7662512.1 hypothetical protein [Thiohalophilus sp.]
MGIVERKRPEDQTTEEWLAEFAGSSCKPPRRGVQIEGVPKTENSADEEARQFRYIGHRTTRTGSVALEFEALDGQLQAVKFFNVGLKSRQGNNYPAGKNGQFNPPERGKFRQFWMEAVGEPPSRWCRVHKSLRSKLGKLVFTGEIEHCLDGKGAGYYKITSISLNKET